MAKKEPMTLRVLNQTGKRKDISTDKTLTALPPGKRVSSTGNVYWETRRNRSDRRGRKI